MKSDRHQHQILSVNVKSKKRTLWTSCKTDTDSQTLKILRFPNETGGGWGVALVVWDGNAIKLGCDDHCTTINELKFIE